MIDDHAHPFELAFTPLELHRISLDVSDDAGAAGRRLAAGPGRLFAELLTVSLGRLLGVPAEEALAARDEAAGKDWAGWVQRLFADADIRGMLLDDGAGTSGAAVGAFDKLTGLPVWRLARVDPLVDELIGAGASASEVIAGVEDFMAAAADQGAVGFKTILAYRTGLAVDPEVSLAAAQASLSAGASQDVPVRRRAKPLRDLVVRTVLSRAADLGHPVQVHTGFGDSELRLAESDPLLLEELLRSPAGSAADVVLIHGYPWHEQVAYLATVRPNVYAEVSLSNLFAPLGIADRLARILDLAPREKVLAGSDGHEIPESHWFACRVLQEGFGEVSQRLLLAGARPVFVEATRQAVFWENALTVYRLR